MNWLNGRMDAQPKKRSLPASLVASAVPKQDLPTTLPAIAHTRHTAAATEKRARRLPASLIAEAEQEQQSLPDLTLSNVRTVAPESKAVWHLALSRLLVLVMTRQCMALPTVPRTMLYLPRTPDSVSMLSAMLQCRVIYVWLPFEVDNWCRRLLAASPCVVGLDIEWHVTYVAGDHSPSGDEG